MKTLSRDGIQRMAGGISTNTSVSGGGGGGSTGISAGWVEANFLSKDFFNLLFEVHINTKVTVTDGLETTETNTAGVLSPNDTIPEDVVEQDTPSEGYTTTTHVSITSIEAKSNFWSSLAISALGLNSGGGGGGGASTLGDLLDVQLTSPQNGQALIYNSSLGKWVNGNATAGTVTSVGMTVPTGLSVSPATITSSGTFAITFASGYSLPTTAKQTKWDTVYNWYVNDPLSGYATKQWVNNKGYLTSINATMINNALGFTLSGTSGATYNLANFLTGITSSMVTGALGFTPLSNATTFWGQQASNGVVSGNMTSVGSIEMSNMLYMANGMSIRFKPNGGDGLYWNVLTMNAANTLAIGFYTRTHGQATDIQGGSISFAVNGGSGTASNPIDNRLEAMGIDGNGRVWIRQAAQGLRIGDGLITWDSSHNAMKISDAWGNSASLYALGAISALGFSSSGGTTSIDSLTINSSILVNDYAGSSLKALSVTKATSSTTVNYLNIGETWKAVYHDTRVYGYNVQLVSGNGAYALSMNGAGKVTCPNYLQASRIYLDSTRYLYLSGSNLYFYNGSSAVQIA